ncbi:hypothetical protein [Gibbsiella quercinecans]|uniref:hypothetical protein n=1 Tax=Gibbsiella quercinecans TaxID=929813 RepID=UPI0010484A48|nr:hypothetical protein [Gibbsiella quercinecans]
MPVIVFHYHHSPSRTLSAKHCATYTNDVPPKKETTASFGRYSPPPARLGAICYIGAVNTYYLLPVRGVISSSSDVFANAQRIVKVKEAKSEQHTAMKTQIPIFSYEFPQ